MKKKIFAGFLATAMAATMLTGCGSDKGAATGSGSNAASSGGDGYNMTLIMSLRDEFLSALEAGCKEAADQDRSKSGNAGCAERHGQAAAIH